jgi:hypothetical protein
VVSIGAVSRTRVASGQRGAERSAALARWWRHVVYGCLLVLALFGSIDGSAGAFSLTEDPFSQQGEKLTSPEIKELSELGHSVALSQNGDTALVGANAYNGFAGGAFVFVRTGSTWAQQAKLVGKEGVKAAGKLAEQGFSVALSADGNTALIGAPENEGAKEEYLGASWVFVRSGTTWKEQAMLVGGGGTEKAAQGESVALSASGNTALVGGFDNNSGVGAAWVFTRSGETWTQKGSPLVGNHGGETLVQEGTSVALSGNGETALIGGPRIEHEKGAVWVFTLAGGSWKEQAELPAGSGTGEDSAQGFSLALSGDGNTAVEGGRGQTEGTGAAWVFGRSGSSWSQQGELLGEDATLHEAAEGESVSLSEDGNTALVGGYKNDLSVGAAWAYARSGSTWAEQQKIVGEGGTAFAEQGAGVALSGDGATALVGGPGNNAEQGAAWIFTRSVSSGEPPKEEHQEEHPQEHREPVPGGGPPIVAPPTEPPSGIATTPEAIEELLLGCTHQTLVLNDVLIRGGRVLLEGSAARGLDGKKVKIIFAGKKPVATATVGTNGVFTTTAPLPPANVRDTNGARYMAESGKERSLNLKLTRRLLLEPPKFSGGTVTLSGQVVAPLTKPVAPIDVDQTLECGKTTIVKKFTPPASGRFHVTLSVPAAAKAGIYRLSSTVRETAADKRGFPTFSLPLPVIL